MALQLQQRMYRLVSGTVQPSYQTVSGELTSQLSFKLNPNLINRWRTKNIQTQSFTSF